MKRSIFLISSLLLVIAATACGMLDMASDAAPPATTPIAMTATSLAYLPAPTMGAADAAVGGVVAPVPMLPATTARQSEQEAQDGSTGEPVTEGQFADYGINPFEDTAQDNLSTFAMDVDTASYTLARGYLTGYSQMPPQEAIRAEEFINYLPAEYALPTGDDAFALHLLAAPAPFVAPGNLLLRVGIQGQAVLPQDRLPALLVFVIDVSGSMDSPERLGLAKEALRLLVPQLREDDRVALVIYADEARVVLEPTPASEQQTILSGIDRLMSSGSTYAEAGLRLGYNVARQHMRPDTLTRVILLSDGVANVGQTGPEAILNVIRTGVEEGVTLSTIGFGMGSFNDVLMEQLANDGNGNYFYVDSLREARRIFVNNLTSTLQVIGYDAKTQVEFNADVVAQYRLIGYENRAIADSDFRNDTVDAGEVGAGHSVTALYEVQLQPQAQAAAVLATAFIRYEHATTRTVIEQQASLTLGDALDGFEDAPVDFRLHAAMAELAELLRGSPYAAEGSYLEVLQVVTPLAGNNVYAAEIAGMAQAAQTMTR